MGTTVQGGPVLRARDPAAEAPRARDPAAEAEAGGLLLELSHTELHRESSSPAPLLKRPPG